MDTPQPNPAGPTDSLSGGEKLSSEPQTQNVSPVTPVTQPQPAPMPAAPTTAPQQQNHTIDTNVTKPLSKSEKIKRSFFQVLIGSLLGAAAIAVIAVLLGSFNSTLSRALGTILTVALHSLLGFSYITKTEKRDEENEGRGIELFSNTVFALIAISFITSVFAIWQLIGGEITLKLYLFYGVILFATLHADVLFRIRGFEKRIDNLVAANYVSMSFVVIMLTMVIFTSSPSDLGEFFYRLLAAIGIIDATMTITVIIMHKLYLQKHPKLANKDAEANAEHSKNFWKNPLVIILYFFLGIQVILISINAMSDNF